MSEDLKKKPRRYSISVTGCIYDRLRTQVTSGSVASFVDEIVEMALDDSTISNRIVAACRQVEGS
jgi:hypothetical protein